MIITTSMFGDWLKCKTYFQHKRITKTYRDPHWYDFFAFGSSIEQPINFLTLYPEQKENALQVWKNEWSLLKTAPITWSTKWDHAAYLRVGQQMIEKLTEKLPPFMGGAVDVQRLIIRDIPGTSYQAGTYIDYLWFGDEGTTVINLKTSAGAYPEAPGIAQLDWQLAMEAWLTGADAVAFLVLPKKNGSVQWICSSFPAHRREWIEKELYLMAEAIRQGEYGGVGNPRAWGGICGECEYLGPCLLAGADGMTSSKDLQSIQSLVDNRLAPVQSQNRTGWDKYLWILAKDVQEYQEWTMDFEKDGLIRLKRPAMWPDSAIINL